MLTLLDDSPGLGSGLTRREWLRVGSFGAGAFSLPQLLAARQVQAQEAKSKAPRQVCNGFGRAKSVILFWLTGGPAQQESWDPKPQAPVELRGPFQPIATQTPGLHVCELMPQTAQLTDKIAVLRAVVTDDNAHSSSGYAMLTGVPHIPPHAESVVAKAPNLWPCADSIVRLLRPVRNGLPASVVLPEHIWNEGNFPWPGQDAGFLGHKFDPWLIHCDPNSSDFKIPDLSFPSEIPPVRFDARRTLLQQVNQHLDEALKSQIVRQYSEESQQAIGLLSATASRKAFDLSQESDATRDRYGRSRYAQSVLLSRRLVEAGVSIVRINWTRIKDKPNKGGWDTHESHSQASKDFLMPMMDQAYSALLQDLEQRGLLDETLVVWLGEFGRTPRFNGNGGRDHWGKVFSIAMAGGGIRGGVVHGSSDRDAAYPVEGRVEPRDILATIYHCLGYPAETEIHDSLGRPFPISRGDVIHQLL
ncbi:MAG: hypothetical protein JWM11_6142 [Planctomycetaceae bacterium]|nr:hypothetical protein [Planctomycetaceae bacterium]